MKIDIKNLNIFLKKEYFEIFENVEFNYYLTNRDKVFKKLLLELDKEVYIYGAGQVGILLKEFLEENNIKVLGIIDDCKKGFLKIDEIDKNKQLIIATFKKSVIIKIYSKLLKQQIYKIVDLL